MKNIFLKTILALLLIIPSLSWGKEILNNDKESLSEIDQNVQNWINNNWK